MRKTMLLLASLSVLCLVAGCSDSEASQRTQARAEYTKAMALYQSAYAGFVPADFQPVPGQAPSVGTMLDDFRQSRIQAAAAELNKLLDQGDDAQKALVRQMLADIHTTSAQFLATQAMAVWSELTTRIPRLTAGVLEIDSLAGRARLFEMESSRIEAELIKQLGESKDQQDQKLGQLTAKAGEMEAQMAALQKEMDQFTAQVDDKSNQARTLREQAFTKEGKAQFDLYQQAVDLERQAGNVNAQAQQLGTKHDVFASEKAILDQQIQMTQKNNQALAQLLDEARNRQTKAEEQRENLLSQKQERVEAFRNEVEAAAALYSQGIEPRFAQAHDRMKQALELLVQAQQLTPSADRKSLAVSLASKRMAQAFVMTQQFVAASGYAQVLQNLARDTQRLGESAAIASVQSAADAADKNLADLNQQIQAIMTQAQEAVDALPSEMASQYRDILKSYEDILSGNAPARSSTELAPAPDSASTQPENDQ